MVHEADAKRLKQYKKELNKRLPVERLILFGSRARGDARPDSDYDLIISKAFAGTPFLKRPLPCYEVWDFTLFPAGADILCYTPEEFERKRRGLNVLAIADREGVTI